MMAIDLEAELRATREEIFLLQTLMDTIPDSIYFKDRESRFTRINRYTAARLGLADASQAIGKTDFDFFTAEHAAQAFRDEQTIVQTGRPMVGIEEKETLKDGAIRWVSTTKMPLRDSSGRIIGSFGISRDITDKKRIEEQLERQAFYDFLTQLPNRRFFLNRLEHLFQRVRRRDTKVLLFAVVYLDLDRFKAINDALGHQAGDELLVQFAQRLRACLRASDTLARLGGDEFTILLEDIADQSDATGVAERILEASSAPFQIAGTTVFATVSLGIAFDDGRYRDPGEMLRDADSALYRAKSNGRARQEIFAGAQARDVANRRA
jgi:diguanylate cyclase (GGDEF)-like protein/PAS domain S-box-containing protein